MSIWDDILRHAEGGDADALRWAVNACLSRAEDDLDYEERVAKLAHARGVSAADVHREVFESELARWESSEWPAGPVRVKQFWALSMAATRVNGIPGGYSERLARINVDVLRRAPGDHRYADAAMALCNRMNSNAAAIEAMRLAIDEDADKLRSMGLLDSGWTGDERQKKSA